MKSLTGNDLRKRVSLEFHALCPAVTNPGIQPRPDISYLGSFNPYCPILQSGLQKFGSLNWGLILKYNMSSY